MAALHGCLVHVHPRRALRDVVVAGVRPEGTRSAGAPGEWSRSHRWRDKTTGGSPAARTDVNWSRRAECSADLQTDAEKADQIAEI